MFKDWVTFISKNPQKGMLKEVRPYIQQVDKILERIMGGMFVIYNIFNHVITFPLCR